MAPPRDPLAVRLSVQSYRLLLQCYPAQFRTAYGHELQQVFRDCCREAYHSSGTVAVARLWPGALADLVLTACLEWLTHNGELAMLVKRAFDLAVASLLLLLTAPLQLVIAVLIRLDSPGPALYRDPRLGRGGRPFTLLKFRTMTVGAAPSVTRVGRWLRRSSLDELPQLLNVLRGEMSLVGPRPAQRGRGDIADADWQRLLAVVPGVAGPGQLARASGASAEDERARSLAYLERRGLGDDLRILVRTLAQLTRRH